MLTARVMTVKFAEELSRKNRECDDDDVMQWLQIRFDFDSTAVRLLIKGH